MKKPMSRLFPITKGVIRLAASRKDSKGRLLKAGESERKDGLYQYRFTEASGERKSIYANNLNDLCKKEQEIQKFSIMTKSSEIV